MFNLGPREFIVGLGSNSPNALTMLRRAKDKLRAHPLFCLQTVSPLYESDAQLPENAPANWNIPFLNAACRIEIRDESLLASPHVAAHKILFELKEIELSLGRIPAPRWAPRLIDLDLLAWGMLDVKTHQITVPHSELLSRPFALLPTLDCVSPKINFGSSQIWRSSFSEQVPFRTKISSAVWPEIMGIVNLTPDSFSEARRLTSEPQVESCIRTLVQEGASIIDVGAESTRPLAEAIGHEKEISRLAPWVELIIKLKDELKFKLSLDTRHFQTLAWALEHLPLDFINDVEGFSDPKMLALAGKSGCGLMMMHSLGVPPARERVLEVDKDPVEQLKAWAKAHIGSLIEAGIRADRIVFDPGIGFGKTLNQNLEVLLRAQEFNELGVKILIGHSRKRFLDPEEKLPAKERDLETALICSRLARSGVDILRLHTPAFQLRALQLGSRFIG